MIEWKQLTLPPFNSIFPFLICMTNISIGIDGIARYRHLISPSSFFPSSPSVNQLDFIQSEPSNIVLTALSYFQSQTYHLRLQSEGIFFKDGRKGIQKPYLSSILYSGLPLFRGMWSMWKSLSMMSMYLIDLFVLLPFSFVYLYNVSDKCIAHHIYGVEYPLSPSWRGICWRM